MSTDQNVFVLSVDSLRSRNASTAIERIADRVGGVEFVDAVATAPQTASAMPGLAAGVYHDATPARGLGPSGPPKPLAEILDSYGYECGLWTDNFLFGEAYNYDRGFTGGNLGRPNWKKRVANAVRDGHLSPLFSVLEWGYFSVVQPILDVAADDNAFYRPAESLQRDALRWLDGTEDRPVLCWIHYMDTHHPYQPPGDYVPEGSYNERRSRAELGQFTRDAVKANGRGLDQAALEDLVATYEACASYVGDELVSFVEELCERGQYDPDRDVLVVTADHGECLTPEPYGMLGHLPAAYWEEIVQVPLLVARPDWSRQVVEQQVSLIDVMPTVLDAVGVPVPESAVGEPAATPRELATEFAYGLSIPFDPDGQQTTYRSVRDEAGWKLFGAERRGRDETVLTRFEADGTDPERILHATASGDPPEDPVHERHWHRLRERLDGFGPPVQQGRDESRPESDLLKGHLRDLGYID